MTRNETIRPRLKKAGYLFLGLLTLAVLALSLLQLWVFYTVTDIPAYGNIRPNAQGLPPSDQRGAFLVLKEEARSRYPSTLILLLPTTEPGVVSEKEGAHVLPADLEAILIQSAALDEEKAYRVYRLAEPGPENFFLEKQPGNKLMYIRKQTGIWPPGAYIIDIPAEGMFGGRTYFQFYVDDEQ